VGPTVLGFDPLMQFIHENDFFYAQRLVIENDCPGIFNLASRGVIPLSKAIRLMGKIRVPLSLVALKAWVQALWYLDISPAPAAHLEYLKYMCVLATEKAEREMGFVPHYTVKDALLDFVGAERLREVRLKEEWMNP
jgi:UDP-glucose 4-epimerase